jgi:hypothetical protein
VPQGPVICIVGSHRGGTSIITKVLNLLGVQLGPHESMLPAGFDNLTGFWEQTAVVTINDEVLIRLGGSWYQPPTLSPGWERTDSLDDLVEKARTFVVAGQLGAEGVCGFKDPRTSLLIPFWRRVIPEMRFVVCVRHPLEVQRSLSVRNGFTASHGYTLWATYMSTALLDTATSDRLIVHYDNLFNGEEWRRMAQFLGVEPPSAATVEQITHAVRKDLRHHNSESDDTSGGDDVPSSLLALYHALRLSGTADDAVLSCLVEAAARAVLEWAHGTISATVERNRRLTDLEAGNEALETELKYTKALVENLKAEIRRTMR